MADFKTVLLNKAALKEALSSLKVGDAIKAHENLTECMSALKLPSDDLLKMMSEQGLSIEDFAPSQATAAPRKPRNNKLENQSFVISDDQVIWVKGRSVSSHRESGDTIYKYDELPKKYKDSAAELVKAG
ncbi:hypothetical protein BEL05_00760 [Shewanella colwelliana]|uniref:Uncharacterized protein n=1 Tax=Shewanella colwelliana TaxID=23 RepID=A0A1E5IW86_SHECO|nr:hypothetical protein [Shewanella colwelliana]OEG74163.1 hypothetical protein BEL05_00760 [Shewanella colwelliana]